MIKDKLKEILIENKGNILISRTPLGLVQRLVEKLFPVRTDKDLIRIGPNGDGGYLIPNDLDGIEACFSPGVDVMSDFELACYKLGMKLFLADKSVEKPNLDLEPESYNFLKKYIGCTDNAETTTLDSWVNSCDLGKGDLLLQMDIEGWEYASLINVSNSLLKRCRILVIEFHNLNDFWNPNFFNVAEITFNKILETHTCVHIHPNNCCGIETKYGLEIPKMAEFTFLRNDRIKHREFVKSFPHKLDFDNENKPHIALPESWYKKT